MTSGRLVGVGTLATPPASVELLRRMLDQYEAGARFERADARDVLLRLDERDFPEAFASDGHDVLLELEAAIDALDDAGALRVVRRRARGAGEQVELRLGPAELRGAYEIAHAHGYLALREALDRLVDHLHALRAARAGASAPEWWVAFLGSLAAGAARADLSGLRIDDRQRLKSEWAEIRDALTAADALSRTVDTWERHLSESLFSDSKRLGRIRPRVAQLLRSADPRWLDVPAGERTDSINVVTQYGVRRRPPVITVAGAFPIPLKADRLYELADFAPAAILPASWGPAVAAGASAGQVQVVSTIENEYPFLAYIEEAGGPSGLGARAEMVVYVGGFPSVATMKLLTHLVAGRPSVAVRHWGDADAGGLTIWWHLRSQLGRPVELYRTTAAWVEEAASRDGQRLSESERLALRALVARLQEAMAGEPDAADLPAALSLAETLLRLGIKLEQERI